MTIPLSQDINDFAAALLGGRDCQIVIEADSLPTLRGAFGLLAAQARALEIRVAAMEAIARDLDVMPAADTGGDEVMIESEAQAAARETGDRFRNLVASLPAGRPVEIPGANVVLLNRARRPAFCDGHGPKGGAA